MLRQFSHLHSEFNKKYGTIENVGIFIAGSLCFMGLVFFLGTLFLMIETGGILGILSGLPLLLWTSIFIINSFIIIKWRDVEDDRKIKIRKRFTLWVILGHVFMGIIDLIWLSWGTTIVMFVLSIMISISFACTSK